VKALAWPGRPSSARQCLGQCLSARVAAPSSGSGVAALCPGRAGRGPPHSRSSGCRGNRNCWGPGGDILSMSLAGQPIQLGDPGLMLAPVAIAAERPFGILGQLIAPPAGKTGMDAVLAGDLSERFVGLKLGYY